MRKPESAEIKHVSSVRKKINVELKLTRRLTNYVYFKQRQKWTTKEYSIRDLQKHEL